MKSLYQDILISHITLCKKNKVLYKGLCIQLESFPTDISDIMLFGILRMP